MKKRFLKAIIKGIISVAIFILIASGVVFIMGYEDKFPYFSVFVPAFIVFCIVIYYFSFKEE